MRLLWMGILILAIGAELYLIVLNRNWPANTFVRVGVLMAIGAIIGIVWVILRTPPEPPSGAD